MKVTCEYCGGYVEADENMKCPLCCAELGSAVAAEQERVEQAEEAEREREAEEKAAEAKQGTVSQIIQGVTSVATAIAAGATHSSAAHRPAGPMGEPPQPDGKHIPREHFGSPGMRDAGFRQAGGPGGPDGRGGGHGGPRH